MSIFSFRQRPSAEHNSASVGSNDLKQVSGVYCTLDDLMSMRWHAKSLALPSAKRVSRDQLGSHHSRFRGRGMEFSEVRAYQPGDDVRSIDWRVTARRQKTHTKIFHEERERPILIVCDQSKSMFFGSQSRFKSVVSAQLAALFSWSALSHSDRVGGIVFNDSSHKEFKPTLNRKHLLNYLHAISDFNQALKIGPFEEPELSFSEVLKEVVRLAKPGTLIIFISDFMGLDDSCEKELSQLANHCEFAFIQTQDPLEIELPTSGFLPISNGNGVVTINNQGHDAKNRYKKWVNSRQDYLMGLARSYRAPFLKVDTTEDPVTQVRRLVSGLF